MKKTIKNDKKWFIDIAKEKLIKYIDNGKINEKEIDKLLINASCKLEKIPTVGTKLSYVPLFISMIKSYIKKEYTDLPITSIIAMLFTIAYVVSPIDLIPSFIPFVGKLDDIIAISLCLSIVGIDVEKYKRWYAG